MMTSQATQEQTSEILPKLESNFLSNLGQHMSQGISSRFPSLFLLALTVSKVLQANCSLLITLLIPSATLQMVENVVVTPVPYAEG